MQTFFITFKLFKLYIFVGNKEVKSDLDFKMKVTCIKRKLEKID